MVVMMISIIITFAMIVLRGGQGFKVHVTAKMRRAGVPGPAAEGEGAGDAAGASVESCARAPQKATGAFPMGRDDYSYYYLMLMMMRRGGNQPRATERERGCRPGGAGLLVAGRPRRLRSCNCNCVFRWRSKLGLPARV